MRKFHSENFSLKLADGLSSIHIDTPDEDAQEALDYIKQFIQRSNGNAYLHRGYLPRDYLDQLIRIRDANDSRQFSRAVEALGVEGRTSTEVHYDQYEHITVANTQDNIETLNDTYYEVNGEETKKMVRTIQDLIRYNNRDLELVLPLEISEQLPNLE